jgi:hypothetical protein
MLFTALGNRTAVPIRNAKGARQNARMKRLEVDVLEVFEASYGAVLRTEAGRHVIHELMVECGVFVEDGAEGERVHYNRGRRAIGLRILATLNGTFQKEFVLMQREAWARAGVADSVIAEAAATEEPE